jgi:PhnB protein
MFQSHHQLEETAILAAKFSNQNSFTMTTVNIYLTFNGNCEEAFNFYKSVFGGEFPYVGRYKDMPSDGGKAVAEEDADKIMHMSLPISKETMLMGSDTGGEWASSYSKGNNFAISISTNSKEEADRLFNGLSAGGQVTMPLNNTFWGDYFGMFTDKFGINWMMSYNPNYMNPEEKKAQ